MPLVDPVTGASKASTSGGSTGFVDPVKGTAAKHPSTFRDPVMSGDDNEAIQTLQQLVSAKGDEELSAAYKRLKDSADPILKSERVPEATKAEVRKLLEAQSTDDRPWWADVLHAIDLPRASLVAIGHELGLVARNVLKDEDNDVSLGHVKQEIDDRIGTGDVIEEAFPDAPHPLKLLGGLAGDVALDPLTYTTLGSPGLARAGTEGVAEKLLTEGVETLGKEAADDAARRLLNRGVQSLSKDELAAVGEQGGLHFAGKQVLPKAVTDAVGLGKLSEGGHLLGNAVRASKVGRAFGGEQAALRVLARGGDAAATDAFRVMIGERSAKAAARGMAYAHQVRLHEILKPFRGKGDDLALALEEGPSSAAWRALRGKGADPSVVRSHLDELHTLARANGIEVPHLENYFPHRLTSAYRDYLRSGGKSKAAKRGVEEAFEQTRAYKKGVEFLGRPLSTGSVEELNRIAKDVLGEDALKLFKSNAFDVLPEYVNEVSRRVAYKNMVDGLVKDGALASSEARTLTRLGAHEVERRLDRWTAKIEKRITRADARRTKALSAGDYVKASRQSKRIGRLEVTLDSAKRALRGDPVGDVERTARIAELERIASPRARDANELNFLQRADEFRSAGRAAPSAEHREFANLGAAYFDAQAEWVRQGFKPITTDEWSKLLTDEKFSQRLVEMFNTQYGQFSDGLIARDSIIDALHAGDKLADPTDVSKLKQSFDYAHGLWKGYAVLTPGFHARNFYGGVFNNWLAGVTPTSYLKFRKLDAAWRKATKAGKALTGEDAAIMEKVLATGALAEANFATEVARRETLTGLGHAQRANPFSRQFEPLQVNRFAGAKVEELLRGTLAYDVIVKGGTVDDALRAVHKFHFDYEDLSHFEKNVMKRVVPFYTWTRNNLPLQLEMMAKQPGKFADYMHVVRNVSADNDDSTVIPSYYSELGAFRPENPITGEPLSMGGESVYLMPDLPLRDLSEFFRPDEIVREARQGDVRGTIDAGLQFAEQSASSLNPFLKAGIESFAGKSLFKGIPLDEDYSRAPDTWTHVPGLLETMDVLGLAEHTVDGGWVMKGRHAQLLEGLVPPLGRLRRAIPSEERYQSRHTSSLLSLLIGASIRVATVDEQRNEFYRRNDIVQQLLKELVARGVVDDPSGR